MPLLDDRLALVVAYVALLLAALLLAAPGPPVRPEPGPRRRKRRASDDQPGCLVGLARYAGIALGVLLPIIVLVPVWRPSWWLLLALVMAIVLGSGAVTLAGTGWLALLRRGPDPVDPQLEVAGGLFELGTYTNVQLHAGPRDLDDCLAMAALLLVGGLFLLGIVAGGLVAERLLPTPTTPGRRHVRGLLCFAYAALIVTAQGLLLRGTA